MKLKWISYSLLGLATAVSGAAGARAWSAAPAPGMAAYQEGGWEAPPPEFREMQRKGFHDGIEGARKDFDNHRSPNVNNRDEYRHPHVDPAMRDDYREGFRRGYDVAWQHLVGH
jgi:hypothetical protein